RYFKAFDVAPGEVVVETGALDTAGPGMIYKVGYYLAKKEQTGVWKEDFQFIAKDLFRRGLGQQGSNVEFNFVTGVWDYDTTLVRSRDYIASNLVPHLPGSCGQ